MLSDFRILDPKDHFLYVKLNELFKTSLTFLLFIDIPAISLIHNLILSRVNEYWGGSTKFLIISYRKLSIASDSAALLVLLESILLFLSKCFFIL